MKRMKQYILAALVATMTLSASAQQVTTMYFLENAPMRHVINPALQPVSKVISTSRRSAIAAFGLVTTR